MLEENTDEFSFAFCGVHLVIFAFGATVWGLAIYGALKLTGVV